MPAIELKPADVNDGGSRRVFELRGLSPRASRFVRGWKPSSARLAPHHGAAADGFGPLGASAGSTAAADGAINVMIVDDDAVDRMSYRRILARAETEYEVSEFATIADALAAVPRIQPHCVLLDLRLPDGDGMEFISRARSLPLGEHPCIVVLTADDTRGLGVEALKAGASDFIVKQDVDSATLERAVYRAYNELKSRRLQLQLESSEKLAAIGRLAAGVAHEVNNPATFVQANLDLLAAHIGERDARGPIALADEDAREVREMLADCRDGIQQIATIVGELRAQTLARLEGVELVRLDDLVSAAHRLVKTQLSQLARVDVHLAAPLSFPGDRSKLTQVVTNLLLNAAQATGYGGVVEVRTSLEDGVATLEVDDDGPGVPLASRARIFEPFYTSKRNKKGMGLGLALCASYVKQHAGEISVGDSALGGASLRVLLPLDNGLRLESEPPPVLTTRVVHGRRPKVLVIDDEPGVLRAYDRVLSGEFELALESDPRQALRRLQTERFDAVISETLLGDFDASTLLRSVRQRLPTSPFVFCTGGTVDQRMEAVLGTEGVALLTKPIDFARLRSVLPRSDAR